MIRYTVLALLLQAEKIAEIGASASDLAEEMVSSGALDQSGFLNLLLQTGPLAKIVLLLLLGFSVLSWAIAFSKLRLLKISRSNNTRFLRAFRRSGQLGKISEATENYRPAPLVTVFELGYDEIARQVNRYRILHNKASLERCLQLGTGEEMAHLQRNMGWLATTASATPFIGLFGTVWGILEAFRGLGQAGGATLRAVAPGIAEALIATAAGLFAAIPALIFFNYFSQRIRELRAQMEDFSLEFFNLAEQSYGEQDGILKPESPSGRVDL